MRLAPILPLFLLAACQAGPRSATASLPLDATGLTRQLAGVKDDLDAADRLDRPAPPPVVAAPVVTGPAVPALRGLGFAQIAGQPGKTTNERRLMAIRAARVDALRDLAEQVHGIRLSATTTVGQAVVADDRLTAMVSGTIRGARTLRVTPKGQDSYEVEMALDRATVGYILRALRGQG